MITGSSQGFPLEDDFLAKLKKDLETPHPEATGPISPVPPKDGESSGAEEEMQEVAVAFLTPEEWKLPQYANILTVRRIGTEYTIGLYVLSAPPLGEGDVPAPAVCVGRFLVHEDYFDQMISLLVAARGGGS